MLTRWLALLPGHLRRQLPALCAVCARWPAQTVCDACVERFAQPVPRCSTCALPVPDGVGQCGVCLKQPPPVQSCLAAVAYAYPWSRLIVGFKFHNDVGQAATLAGLLRSTPWVEPALEQADLVLPMPLSPQRLRQRGYNQALLLAQELSPGHTEANLLLRIRHTDSQATLDRAARLQNVLGAFAVDPLQRQRLDGARVVLVDDVMTSGASLFAAAQALQDAGAAHMTALVLARTVLPA